MTFNDFLFRCFSLGNIMTNNSRTNITALQVEQLKELEEKYISGKITGMQKEKRDYLISKRDAPNELAQGSKTHCKNILKGKLFNRERQFHSKYTDKGTEKEESGITLASEVFNKMYFKNEKHYRNNYIQGTPDIITDIVIDIKCSWDLHTFPMFEDNLSNSLYEWQVKGYCALTGCNNGQITYCLVDTPESIINDEIRRLDWSISLFDGNGNVYEDKIQKVVDKISMMIYTRKGLEEFCFQDINIKLEWFNDFVEIPKKLRIKTYDIELYQEDIERIESQVLLAREYMNQLAKSIEI